MRIIRDVVQVKDLEVFERLIFGDRSVRSFEGLMDRLNLEFFEGGFQWKMFMRDLC